MLSSTFRGSLPHIGLSLTLMSGCGSADRPPRIGNPDLTPETPDAGDAGPAMPEAGASNHGAKIHYDYVGFGKVLTPEMMCAAADAGGVTTPYTHTCTWSLPRQLTDNPGRIDRDPALVATGDAAAPVGLSWTGADQILFRILDGQGSALTSEAGLSNAVAAGNSHLAYDGTNFAVVWDDRTDPNVTVPLKVDFRLVDTQGLPGLATNLIDSGWRADKPVVTAIDTGWVAMWGDGRPGGVGLYGSVLTPQGSISLGEQALTLSAQGAILPSVTWTGAELAVSWHDNRDGNAEIYFGQFDTSLQPIESSGQAITQRDWVSSEPTVVTIDGGFAVSWLENFCGSLRAHLTLLDETGGWLIPEQIFPHDNASAASVAWDADNGVLGVLYVTGDVTGRDLYFQLLDKKGHRLNEETHIAGGVLGSSETPQLIWTPDGFMTAFEDTPGTDREIYTATGTCSQL